MSKHNAMSFGGFSGWFDGAALWLIEYAAGRTPGALAERLREEWLADMCERRGQMSRLKFSLGCLWAAIMITHDGSPGMVLATATAHSPIVRASGGHGRPLYSRNEIEIEAPAICDINTAPLIDVMLVLLITLILSLPILTHAAKIELPQAPPITQPVQPEVIDLDIDFDGAVFWNGTLVADSRQLEGYFRTQAKIVPQAELRLRPNPHAKYDVIAKVLASAQRNGMRKVGFVNTGEFSR